MTEIIAGAGFAGTVALLLIKFLVDFVKHQQKTIENHIKHQTKATEEMVVTLRDIRDVLKDNSEVIKANGAVLSALQEWVRSQARR